MPALSISGMIDRVSAIASNACKHSAMIARQVRMNLFAEPFIILIMEVKRLVLQYKRTEFQI